MQNTNIEWTDHTLNFWWGCTKVSPACTHCYAESVAKVFGKRLFGTVPQWGAGKPRYQRLEAARKEALTLNKRALRTGTRPRVFVNSMSDWLDAEVPIEWLAYLLETIHLCPNLDFQLLTKRPENWHDRIKGCWSHFEAKHGRGDTPHGDMLHKWFHDDTPPPNVWLGTTVEDQTRADQRLPHLLHIPARIRFLSCEPLLGPVDISHLRIGDNQWFPLQHLHWVIAGGESGGPARPTHPDWFRSLRDQCAAAQVPFFFKQWGEFIEAGISAAHLPQDRTYKHTWIPTAPIVGPANGREYPGELLMLRAGTDHTGRHLDGHLHDAFPKV